MHSAMVEEKKEKETYRDLAALKFIDTKESGGLRLAIFKRQAESGEASLKSYT